MGSEDTDWSQYDSGPFCEHWSDPESCTTCAWGKVSDELSELFGIMEEAIAFAKKSKSANSSELANKWKKILDKYKKKAKPE
jgi:hypothetical protein